MFWMFFGSDDRVEQALKQSKGYDISPNDLPAQLPANMDTPRTFSHGNNLAADSSMTFQPFWDNNTRKKA